MFSKTFRRPIKIKSSQRVRSIAGWRSIGGKRFYSRSKWEANYARFLQWQKSLKKIQDWEHEPKTFWFAGIKRGCVTYLPDFRVDRIDGTHFWAEVKGYMDAKSRTKIKRFQKYYPQEELFIAGQEWFAKNSPILQKIILGWE